MLSFFNCWINDSVQAGSARNKNMKLRSGLDLSNDELLMFVNGVVQKTLIGMTHTFLQLIRFI